MKYKAYLSVFVLSLIAILFALPANAQDASHKEKTYKRAYYKDRKIERTDKESKPENTYKDEKTEEGPERMEHTRRSYRRAMKEKRNHSDNPPDNH